MARGKTKVLLGAMLLLLALVPGRAEAQCWVCGTGRLVKTLRCLQGDAGYKICQAGYDEVLGNYCIHVDPCGWWSMGDGAVAPDALLALSVSRFGLFVAPAGLSGLTDVIADGLAGFAPPCSGAVPPAETGKVATKADGARSWPRI